MVKQTGLLGMLIPHQASILLLLSDRRLRLLNMPSNMGAKDFPSPPSKLSQGMLKVTYANEKKNNEKVCLCYNATEINVLSH